MLIGKQVNSTAAPGDKAAALQTSLSEKTMKKKNQEAGEHFYVLKRNSKDIHKSLQFDNRVVLKKLLNLVQTEMSALSKRSEKPNLKMSKRT